jgi:tetratricopeptide (TPR) repeat protein
MSCFENALKIYPDYTTAWNNKGVVLYLTKRYDEALECFNKALEISSAQQVWHNKTSTLQKLGRNEEAEECHRRFEEMVGKGDVVSKTQEPSKAPLKEDVEPSETGEDAEDLLSLCPSCGAFTSLDATSCEKCGYDLGEDKSEIATEDSREESIAKLTAISGVGIKKANALYKAGYRSFDILRKASLSEIMRVEGMNKTLAKSIKNQLEYKRF